MWDVAYTATETTSYHEVSKHEAHRDWAYQPYLPSERVYTRPEEVNTWQGYHPYWNHDRGYNWNQVQAQGLEPYWQNNQEAIWNQDQGHGYQPYWQEDPSYALNQSYEQGFQPAQCENPSFQYQWQDPNSAPQFDYPPPPQEPTLEKSLNATTLAVHRSKAMYERIDAQCEQIMGCLNELRKQNLAKESSQQPTYDDEGATMDTHSVTTFERSVDFDDNDDKELIELETYPPEQPYPQQPPLPQEPYPQQPPPSQSIEHESSDVVAQLVEPILVEDADEMCYPDLTDEQEDGEEYTPVFGFSKLTADFFSFQHFYFIPSASYFKDCSGITIADLIVYCCFLQDVGEDCLLVGPADVRDEDEQIQVMEWLRLEKEFG